jgi:hypothetical protein
VRFLERKHDRFVFHLSTRDRTRLAEVLKRFPLLPAGYAARPQPNPGKTTAEARGSDHGLLEAALTDEKRASQKAVQRLLKESSAWRATGDGFRLELTSAQVEWLLQVLNEVRVGSWRLLGCPDPERNPSVALTETNAGHCWAMELCGHFECCLLSALDASA